MPSRPIALIVEDDAQLTHLYYTAFTLAGFAIRRVGDGVSALRSLEQGRPDVVILDLNLPTLSGSAVLREFAENPLTSDIPIIVVSGVDPLPTLPGAARVIGKPIDPDKLARIALNLVGTT